MVAILKKIMEVISEVDCIQTGVLTNRRLLQPLGFIRRFFRFDVS